MMSLQQAVTSMTRKEFIKYKVNNHNGIVLMTHIYDAAKSDASYNALLEKWLACPDNRQLLAKLAKPFENTCELLEGAGFTKGVAALSITSKRYSDLCEQYNINKRSY